MTNTKTTFYGVVGVALILLVGMYLFSPARHAQAIQTSAATVATTSTAKLGTTALTLFATSSCAARIVTTATSSIMITFSDYAGQTPNDSFGHYQAASTTVAYDGGLYGCGLVKAWSQTTQQVTLTETR